MSRQRKILLWVSILGIILFVGIINAMVNPKPISDIPTPIPLSTPFKAVESSVRPSVAVANPEPTSTISYSQKPSVGLWDGFPINFKDEVENAEANEDCDSLEELAGETTKSYNVSSSQATRMQIHIFDIMDELYCDF